MEGFNRELGGSKTLSVPSFSVSLKGTQWPGLDGRKKRECPKRSEGGWGRGQKTSREADLRRRKKKLFCGFSLTASRMRENAGCGLLIQTGLAGNFLCVNPQFSQFSQMLLCKHSLISFHL